MTRPSLTRTHKGRRASMQRTQPVFVVVRHTRSGDKRVAVFDDDGTPARQAVAMEHAEDVANEAAATYGSGATSVFRGVLTITGRALRPKEAR